MPFQTNQPKSLICLAILALAATAGCTRSVGNDAISPAARADLGQVLFDDVRLSADGTISCSTCHNRTRAFSEPRAVSVGTNGRAGTRNAPSLLDVATAKSFFWDGRESDLHQAVLQPFENLVEMGLGNRERLVEQVRSLEGYSKAFEDAYGDPDVTDKRIGAALVAFLQSRPKYQSRFDLSLAPGGAHALNDDERAGLALFQGKAECSDCHSMDAVPATFTDDRVHNAGIGFETIAGNMAPLLSKLDSLARSGQSSGDAILSNADIAALGKFATTRDPADLGAFKTPSLRNVARSAPYMHDGSVPTLEEAVNRELYYRGLARGRPIPLTVEEQRYLVAFMKSLSDP